MNLTKVAKVFNKAMVRKSRMVPNKHIDRWVRVKNSTSGISFFDKNIKTIH